MADSFVQYTASGSTDTFNITMGYLDPTHITVTVDGVSEAFTFPTSAQVQITSGNPTAGAAVRITRATPRTAQQVVWVNAANLTESDLNTADLHLLYIAQEAFDSVSGTMQTDTSGNYDAESNRIVNVATPVASTDAATKAYADANLALTAADVVSAEAAKTAAEAAQAAAETAYDNFDDRYLGQKSSAPTLDNDGNALVDGALYYNTTTNFMAVYDLGTTTWLDIATNITANAVDNTKLADMAQATIKGRADAAGTGDPVDLTAAQVRAIVGSSSETQEGLVESATTAEMTTGTANKFPDAAKVRAAIDAGSTIVQRVYSETALATAITSTIPSDDTIPQNTEGAEVITAAITPTNASNKLRVTVHLPISCSSNTYAIGAVFRDSGADAIGAAQVYQTTATTNSVVSMVFEVDASSTSATTFKLRAGAASGNAYPNGKNTARSLGGASKTTLTVEEISV